MEGGNKFFKKQISEIHPLLNIHEDPFLMIGAEASNPARYSANQFRSELERWTNSFVSADLDKKPQYNPPNENIWENVTRDAFSQFLRSNSYLEDNAILLKKILKSFLTNNQPKI